MTRYWVVAPIEAHPSDVFERVWQFDLANNLISIGWNELGDVSTMNREELAAAVGAKYPDKPLATQSLIANMFWAFFHEITPGDFVIARKGRKTLAGIGRVTGPATYAPGKSPLHRHPNFLPVAWQTAPRDKAFPGIVFPMHTLAELSEEAFRKFEGGQAPAVLPTAAEAGLEDPNEFVLEKYLEDFIVTNFATIFRNALRIYEDADGNDGQQYSTDIGPIDILAQTRSGDSFVVIELKKGRPSDQVVGQVLRYMGWVKKNLCGNGQAVKGLVICRDPDPKLSYALEMTNDIDVRYYTVAFRLKETP
jgi:restriction system protein